MKTGNNSCIGTKPLSKENNKYNTTTNKEQEQTKATAQQRASTL
jgi:hypothetical protein